MPPEAPDTPGAAALEAAISVAQPWIRSPGQDLAPGERLVALAELRGGAPLGALLEAEIARHPEGACPKAIASVWSKPLMAALLPAPTLAALLGHGPDPDPALLFAGGRAAATVAPLPAPRADPPAAAALRGFLEDGLGPLIAQLHAASGVSARVFWSNAATMLAYLFEHWTHQPGLDSRAETLRAALVDAPQWPAARPNPLYRQIAYVPCAVPGHSLARRRRICCLRDRIGQPLCASCPKIDPAARDALLARAR